jgi:integrase
MLNDTSLRESASRLPSYRRHKPSGQAVVTLNGRDFYLGRYGTRQSRGEYDRLIGEWLAAERCLRRPGIDLTVAELAVHYWRFAGSYYRKDGCPTRHLQVVRLALRPLRESYGLKSSSDFGPLALQAVQHQLVATGKARSHINHLCGIIKRVFKWAASQQLIPVTIYQALATVPGLRKGRTLAREPKPVQPVADEVVEATLPHLPEVVADMVRFQRLTGCRPGEVCILRPCDVDTSSDVWAYRPGSHKTEHHGRHRVIFIGPKA